MVALFKRQPADIVEPAAPVEKPETAQQAVDRLTAEIAKLTVDRVGLEVQAEKFRRELAVSEDVATSNRIRQDRREALDTIDEIGSKLEFKRSQLMAAQRQVIVDERDSYQRESDRLNALSNQCAAEGNRLIAEGNALLKQHLLHDDNAYTQDKLAKEKERELKKFDKDNAAVLEAQPA